MRKKSSKAIEKVQRAAGMNQITVLEFILWSSVPFLICRYLYRIDEIPTSSAANFAGLVGSGAAVLLNLFLIIKGSYRLVWKRTKAKADKGAADNASIIKTVDDLLDSARESARAAAEKSGGNVRWSQYDPDWMTVRDPVSGEESGYRLNHDTGEWTNSETGSVLDAETLSGLADRS